MKRLTSGLISVPFLCFCTAAAAGDYPDDPFKWERQRTEHRAIGTTVGQVKLSALGGMVDNGRSNDEYSVGQLTSETVLHEFIGVRFSLLQELQEQGNGDDYKLSSIRFGPSYHLRPYRMIDLGTYLEGGAVIVDLFGGEAESAPEVAFGGFVTIHVGSFSFIKLELQRSWANIARDEAPAQSNHRTMATAGIGVSF